jgi:predicted TIM-barrel fold metal-dependent hydrolase
MSERFAGHADGTQIAGIVGHADMRDPDLDTVIDAHLAEGRGLLRGLRHSTARMEDPLARLLAGAAPAGLCADPDFRRGLALLGGRGLTFDAFVFHHQLAEVRDLARAVPGTVIVLNHLGGPVGYPGAGEMVAGWQAGMDRLADCPNLVVKLGGLASLVTRYDGGARPRPPSSEAFAAERGAYFHDAIRRFGPERCMFESNFPVDSTSIPYGTLWNAFKRIAASYGTAERDMLLAGTARRVYRLAPDRGNA